MTASAPETAVVPEDNPPATRLGFEPDVESLDDVAVALHELAWLESRLATEQAKIDQKIRLLKEEAERQQAIKVGRNATTLSERAAVLSAAIESYVISHKEAITATGKKTRKFTHGEVSLRSSKLSVALTKGKKWQDVLQAVREAGMKRLVVTKYEVDKSRLIDELAADKLTDADLQKLGLQRKPPEDHVNIKPAAYTLAPAAVL